MNDCSKDHGEFGPRPAVGTSLLLGLDERAHRHVRQYFQVFDDPVASVVELTDYAAGRGATVVERDRLALVLHHLTLPRLAESGVIDYDARTRTVRYRSQERPEGTWLKEEDAEMTRP